MNFYNPSEQGYYTLAQKIAGTVFVLSSTILPLILRELSVEVERGNNKEAFLLYNFYGDLLIILISSICIFLIYNIEIIITYIGGSEFLNAKEIVLFLLIFTIFRVRANFSSLMIESYEDTKYLKSINFINYAISFPLVFILVAPKKYLGLELGAVGLSIKIILVQQLYNFLLVKKISHYFKINIWFSFFKDHFLVFILSLYCFPQKYFSLIQS